MTTYENKATSDRIIEIIKGIEPQKLSYLLGVADGLKRKEVLASKETETAPL